MCGYASPFLGTAINGYYLWYRFCALRWYARLDQISLRTYARVLSMLCEYHQLCPEQPIREFAGQQINVPPRLYGSFYPYYPSCVYMQLLPIHRRPRKKKSWEKPLLAAPGDRGNDACRRMRQAWTPLCIRVESPTPNCARVQRLKTPNIPGPSLISHASRRRTGKSCVAPAHPPPFPCCSSPTAAVAAAADVKRNRKRETTTETTTVGLASRPINRQGAVLCSTRAPITRN